RRHRGFLAYSPLQSGSPTLMSSVMNVTGAYSDEGWRESTLWLGLVVLSAFCMGLASPLSDPDLPMHLATGEWMAANRAFPTEEPFAWTRAGEPYYAYS